jgi:hypothetical protein
MDAVAMPNYSDIQIVAQIQAAMERKLKKT